MESKIPEGNHKIMLCRATVKNGTAQLLMHKLTDFIFTIAVNTVKCSIDVFWTPIMSKRRLKELYLAEGYSYCGSSH